MSVLDDDAVCSLLLDAWRDSQSTTSSAHEEGGFILRSDDGTLTVERWPVGAQNSILVPPHPNSKRDNRTIVATFHTHPNPGEGFQQEPSLTDIRAVRDDPDLDHADYEGEFVIASESIYVIFRNGDVDIVGNTKDVLNFT